MKQYRIKKNFDGQYHIEKKKLWYWVPVKFYCVPIYCTGYMREVVLDTYTDAKNYIENLIAKEQIEKARRQFVPKYYYPPLPDKEPI